MNGVTFGSKHSYTDYGLILKSKTIGAATVKTKTVDIEGGHGSLDYTAFFGEPKYNNRTLTFTFASTKRPLSFIQSYSDLMNSLHGQKMKIILDEDPNYHYVGRLSVGDYSTSGKIPTITVTADCEPFKYKNTMTTVSRTVSGSASITLPNMRKKVVPTITTTAEMTIVFGGRTSTMAAGTFVIPTLELTEGDNVVTVTGTGNITFKYQEGGL